VTLRFETRTSDSPWVESVWTSTSEQVFEMTSVAAVRWGLVFWRREGRSYASVTGPESRSSIAPVPDGATFLGIDFAVGTSLRNAPTPTLLDGGIDLPDTTHRTFRLDGVRWDTPGPDDAEALVERLVRAGTVVRDPLVAEVLRGHVPEVSAWPTRCRCRCRQRTRRPRPRQPRPRPGPSDQLGEVGTFRAPRCWCVHLRTEDGSAFERRVPSSSM